MRLHTVTLMLLVSACSGLPACRGSVLPPDGGAPDAGATDGGDQEDGGDTDGGPKDGGPIVRVDWRDVHGDDLSVTTAALGSQELFAVTSDGVVLQDNCDAGPCDYRWLGADGGVAREGLHWQAPYPTTPVSPDGRLLHVVEVSGSATCDTGDSVRRRLEGTLRLVDLESGNTLTSVSNYATYDWGESHFTSRGKWARLLSARGTCGMIAEQLISTQPPYAGASAFTADLVVDIELPDGRWVATRNGDELGTSVPDEVGSFESISSDVQDYDVGGGWVHAYVHSPVVSVVSRDPQGGHHDWPLSSDEEWYGLTGWGRWAALYGRRDATTQARPYRIHDMLGQYADVDFKLKGSRIGAGLTLLGQADLVLLTEADEDGSAAARQIDLRTGARALLSDRTFTPVPLGDSEAAVLYNPQSALLVERKGVTELASGVVTEVYSLGVAESSLSLPQQDLAFIIRSPEVGRFTLDVFNLRNHRMAALTDRLFWSPVVGPVGVENSCGRPWVTRPAGSPGQSRATPAATLFFAEYPVEVGPASLFIAPLDLSEPPRLLDRMVGVYCHSPMQSMDGRHVAALIEGYDTQPRRWLKSATLSR